MAGKVNPKLIETFGIWSEVLSILLFRFVIIIVALQIQPLLHLAMQTKKYNTIASASAC
jgi:hypothetical protein